MSDLEELTKTFSGLMSSSMNYVSVFCDTMTKHYLDPNLGLVKKIVSWRYLLPNLSYMTIIGKILVKYLLKASVSQIEDVV